MNPDREHEKMSVLVMLRSIRKDLIYLEGISDGIGCEPMRKRIESMRITLNNFEKTNGMAKTYPEITE